MIYTQSFHKMYSAFLIHSLINGCVWPGEDEGGEDGAGCHSLLPPELGDLLDSLIKTFQHNTASYKEKNQCFLWHHLAQLIQWLLVINSHSFGQVEKNLKVKQSYIIKTTISTTYQWFVTCEILGHMCHIYENVTNIYC